ncbi:MAG: DUF4012 domain-containing protein [Candidatus Moranbacteria bacterium]|nr:DUF4012 domain-containing protein [Candidatus Moranbacteria bacterium]
MKKYSAKFWIFFVFLSALFLFGWFVFWEVRHQGLSRLLPFLKVAPMKEETRTDMETLLLVADNVLRTDGKERVFLLLFQNNLELRPGGGFIGSFGILKVRDGSVTEFAVHDTGNFDGRIPSTVTPPYPMKETLGIDSWKLRDSNYAPDFYENVAMAERFYLMGNGTEKFDGVIALTTNVLTSFLRVVGPVTLEGFPGTYGADNAIIDLEYQVEQGYRSQNIAFGDRKSVMGVLGLKVLEEMKKVSLTKKYELFQALLADLHGKDIQLFFHDEYLQAYIKNAHWDGAVDTTWKNDYLFAVDANLNSFKSDYFVKRSYDYVVDFSQEKPQAKLSITYEHTAKARDWFTKEYQTFLRVYVPEGSYAHKITGNTKEPVYGEAFGKKYFGTLVQVPLNSEKTVTFEYSLPQNIEQQWYDLKIQKQPGLSDTPVTVTIIKKDGSKEKNHFALDRDRIWSGFDE